MELSRNLRVDSVSRLNPTPARQLELDRTVADAVELMRREKVGCLLVTDHGVLVGIFTERDLMKRVLGKGQSLDQPLRDFMTPSPVTVQAKDSIRTAIERMEEGGHRHLPVVDLDNRPIGILSIKRVVHYLVEHFPGTVYNQPPNLDAVPHHREGA